MSANHSNQDPAPPPSADAALTVEQAISQLQGEDLGLRFYAAWWLGKFRVREPAAISALIAALTDEDDRTAAGGYPLRRNAARALGKLGDRSAVPALINCLDCSDYYVREAAAQALETLGDPAAIPPLTQLLSATSAQLDQAQPTPAQPYDALLEALGSLGAVAAIPLIQSFLDHPTERVQYAAARAMYQLTGESAYGDRLIQALRGPSLQLRRAVLADLGAIGYLGAAEAIAQAHAENSLKLISLKGLIEHHIPADPALRVPARVVEVMKLMDALL